MMPSATGRPRRRALSRPSVSQLQQGRKCRRGVSGNTREASIPQTWVVGNVEHCVKELTLFVREYGITDLVTLGRAAGHAAGTDERQSRTFCARRGARHQSSGRSGSGKRSRMGVGIGLGCAEFPFSGARRIGAGSTCARTEAWI